MMATIESLKRVDNVRRNRADEILSMYQDGDSLRNIGRQLGINFMTVRKILQEHGADIRKPHDSIIICDVCGLEFYKKPSLVRRSDKHFCSRGCMGKWQSQNKVGALHPCWRGGKTKLAKIIRELKRYDDWRSQVFKRDGYTCMQCGALGGTLEAHHIVRFADILTKFLHHNPDALGMYNFGDPAFYEMVDQYRDFWDIDNGVTLCQSCHRNCNNFK